MPGENSNNHLEKANSVESFVLSNAFFFDFLKIETDVRPNFFLSSITTDDFSNRHAQQEFLLKKMDEIENVDESSRKEIDNENRNEKTKNFNKIHLDLNETEPKLAVFSLLSPEPDDVSTVPKWETASPPEPVAHPVTYPDSGYGSALVNQSISSDNNIDSNFDTDSMRKRSQTEVYIRHRSKSDGVIKSALKKSDSPASPTDMSILLKLKRRVSFADAVGHQLEEIRSFEVQNQNSTFYDSDSDEEKFQLLKIQRTLLLNSTTAAGATSPTSPTNSNSIIRPLLERRFVPYFTLPWNQTGKQKLIYAVLEDQKISLETYTINSPWRLSGTILVKNISFSKRVFVRTTLDKWQTYSDNEATYISSVNSNVDRFHFELKFPFKMAPGTRLEVAFGYELPAGQTFWDNNAHNNYAFWFSSSK